VRHHGSLLEAPIDHEQIKVAIVGFALIIAAVFDAWKNRIPNWMTGPLLLVAIVLSTMWSPDAAWRGFAISLFAATVAFALHFVLYLMKLEGAGDAKLMMGISAMLGLEMMLEMTAWRYVLLFPYAIITITVRRRWGNFAAALRWTIGGFLGRDMGERPEPTYMPFGPLIALSFPIALATTWLDYFAK
jgi:Flp pilus assembly protein protease CpaA